MLEECILTAGQGRTQVPARAVRREPSLPPAPSSVHALSRRDVTSTLQRCPGEGPHPELACVRLCLSVDSEPLGAAGHELWKLLSPTLQGAGNGCCVNDRLENQLRRGLTELAGEGREPHRGHPVSTRPAPCPQEMAPTVQRRAGRCVVPSGSW
ncbi:unnamed protein product [Rangifer tarandus platyrhynchus]|uniref:Uncharacterized protein n=1 Tax=Rangifer tarandus platyrhynchus TaxID=3082113 RepID=A0AC59ZMT7_RANTA